MTSDELRTAWSFISREGAQPLSGTFVYVPGERRLEWSDEIYAVHGYQRGEVVPTPELLLAHAHPEDREDAAARLQGALEGEPFSSYRRLIDAQGREHRILITGLTAERNGRPVIVGSLTDLTPIVYAETADRATSAVRKADPNRDVIEQAKGALMARLHLDPDAAFAVLSRRSQETNTKLATLARQLVDGLPDPASDPIEAFRLSAHL